MYLSHFQLQSEPFSISPDPSFLWLSEKLAAAFETLKEGVFNRDGCVLVAGDIGTGKTTLIKRLVQRGGAAAAFVTIHDTGLTRLDFCNILAAEFGINRRFDRREDFYTDFKNVLSGTSFAAHRKVLVVIDEAERLNPEIIRETLELSNLQQAGQKPLKILFVGQLGIDELLKQEEYRDLPTRIAARIDLQPLTQMETRRYVDHRLKVAGRQAPLFTEDAVTEIHVLSKGYPRLINIVCDHALLYGYGSGLNEIDGQVVRDCSRDLTVALDLDGAPDPGGQAASRGEAAAAPDPSAPVRPGRSWRPFLYIAVAVAVAALALFAMTR